MKIQQLVILFCLATSIATSQPIEVTDAHGETVVIHSAERIVSLNGSTTEILFALDVGTNVVGCDASSTYPKHAKETLPSVGYQYQLNAEGILSLRPTLVIGRADVKPPQVIDQLRMAGVTVLLFKEPRTVNEAKRRLRTIGKAVSRQERATALISALEKDIEALKSKLTARRDQPKLKVLFLYLRGPQTAFVLGKDSGPGAMLELVGAANAAGKITGTKPMTAEAVIAAQPEVYVLFESGLKSIGGIDGLLKVPGLAQTPAGRNKRVVAMDGLYLSGFGPRCGKAALDLFRGIYESEGHFIAKGK